MSRLSPNQNRNAKRNPVPNSPLPLPIANRQSPTTKLRSNQGFTLIEALATLVLVAIILPPAMHGISLATSAAGQAVRRMEAAALAEAKLAELLVTGDWEGAELSGDWEPNMPGYRWEAVVEEWDDERVRLLTVRVEYMARGVTREVALTTLVYPGYY